MSQPERILIAGLGSPHGDDQAGWLVAENLGAQCRENSDITVRCASIPLDLLDWMEGVGVLHICDACESTQGHGTFQRFTFDGGRFASPNRTHDTALNTAMNSLRCHGTHDFGLPEVLRLAEATHLLPKRVIIWAIEGTNFLPQRELSRKTQEAVIAASGEIMSELRLTHA